MKHSSFCKGMAKLQKKGISRQESYNRMIKLASKTDAYQGQSKEMDRSFGYRDKDPYFNKKTGKWED